jgi:hypothetical protein
MKTTTLILLLAAAWLAAPCPAHAWGWTNDPVEGMAIVTNETGSDVDPLVVGLSSGSTFIVWDRPYNGSHSKYQVLDQRGNPLLGPTGQNVIEASWTYGVYSAISDSQGGAIVIFGDDRNGVENIYGQRFNSQGDPQWGSTGVPLAVWPGTQDMVLQDLVGDSAGNFFFVWGMQVSGSNADLYAQKFNRDGQRLWGEYGVAVSVESHNQAYPQIVADNSGGLIVVWQDDRSLANNYKLYTQHLDPDGLPMLELNGTPILYNNFQISAGGLQEGVSDGRGGGVWTWNTSGYNNYFKVMRISYSGGHYRVRWLWTSPNFNEHGYGNLLRHPVEGSIWLWESENFVDRLYRWDLDGNLLFSPNGRPYGGILVPVAEGMISLLLDFTYTPNPDITRVKAYRVDNSGNLVWQSLVAIGGETPGGGPIIGPRVATSDGNDGAVVALEDVRFGTTTGIDISAQRVNADGSLGTPSKIMPQPQSVVSGLSFNGMNYTLPKAGQIKLELYDLLGRRMSVLEEGYKTDGQHAIRLDQSSLPAGVYFLQLQAGEQVAVKKAVVVR